MQDNTWTDFRHLPGSEIQSAPRTVNILKSHIAGRDLWKQPWLKKRQT